ncbi:hypothetical protein EIN_521940 [Entamoeba invadens IP1]|uniref:VWFA domain-containing protein n=1 Tax=Entamoeba invadens IP1 TaxID=370355 RepID=A0A0A1U9P0_ENTIV|nr:hypothetical protein EIN_521940 [Entamoeba invadens IP1]ELP91747.1 hypothetical protein EIN_521940 [Entamoeba invadens IP1]|eukprot:XP_004258518.1 hypothetical protein EIN_521940 [Entamoeba invadens IP1]
MLFFGDIFSNQASDDTRLTFDKVHFNLQVIGVSAKVTVSHYLTNNSNAVISLLVHFSYDSTCSITGYSFKTKSKEMVSCLKEKESAKRAIADARASGYNTSSLVQTDETSFDLSLDILNPQETVELKIEYITQLSVVADELLFTLPKNSERSKSTIFDVEYFTNNLKKTVNKIHIENPDLKAFGYSLGKVQHGLYVTEDAETGEKTGSAVFVSKECDGPVDVIFVCDRSGSMDGEGITALKVALQLFLRQLPENSTFDVVSFGSDFKELFGKLEVYGEKSFKLASEKVAQFEADFGGTNILKPLCWAMKRKCQVILLTDGQISETEETQILNLLEEEKGKSIVHCIGLGSDVDGNLIRKIGTIGGGVFDIVRNTENLTKSLSEITAKILRPTISEGKISVENGANYEEKVPLFAGSFQCYFDVKNDQKCIATLHGKNGKKDVKLIEKEVNRIKGELLGQMRAAEEIKKLEMQKEKNLCLKKSLKYNILSQYTSFIVIDKSTKTEIENVKKIEIGRPNYWGEIESDSEELGGFGDLGIDSYGQDIKKEEEQEDDCCIDEMFCDAEPEYVLPQQDTKLFEGFSFVAEEKEKEDVGSEKQCKEEQIESLEKIESTQNMVTDKFQALVCKQNFDGSFEEFSELFDFVKKIYNKFNNIEKKCLATALAVAVLRKFFFERIVEWKLLEKKALNYLEKHNIEEQFIQQITADI